MPNTIISVMLSAHKEATVIPRKISIYLLRSSQVPMAKCQRPLRFENDSLRPFLAEAIAACCVSRETGLLFGQAGAVAPLVQYLETDDSTIRRPTCRALHRLSLEPENCVTLHQSGAVPLLLEMLGSEDDVVQEAAADCLRNIRLLALRRCQAHSRSSKARPSSRR
ncbi:outer dynein arm-docking complex subunit 2-like [Portunus trituberculatus]|uniref:outer dynein arm-docking complex subunit 2-like n=1 Tax=Portunus trituberculatus TaxID=210409 RepID=UPI001E1CBF7E|nr:outer dynein arm-docking complex subunit 2-like [Portunus trituberculatus]